MLDTFQPPLTSSIGGENGHVTADEDGYSLPLSVEAGKLQRSMMRKLIAVTARPDIVSFAGGLPAPELLPVAEWAECLAGVLADDGQRSLQYGPQFVPLQEAIIGWMNGRGTHLVSPEQVFITSGCQQGLMIAARLLMNAESAAVIDRFVFPGVRQAFGGFDRELREVPTHVETGLDLGAVEIALGRSPHPAALVVVPDFHNPLGASLSPQARLDVVELARRYGTAIVEDDPYSSLAFDGRLSKPLVAHAPERTVYLGSFSKMIAPALRLGWMLAPEGLTEKLRVIKESMDLETSALTQRALARFLAEGRLAPHLDRVRHAYQERASVMQAALAAHFPPGTRWSKPTGGMFIWAELPGELDTLALLPTAIDAGVAYIPGAAFAGDTAPASSMRLNFSNAGVERIEAGMAILGRVLRSAGA